MKSFATRFEELARKFIFLLDYTLWFLFDPSKFTRIKKEKIKKVLVIHLGAMGELLIATPVVSALKKELNSQVYFMVGPGKEEIFRNNPNVDKILVSKGFDEDLRAIKKEKFDLAVILWPCFPKISLMCLLAGIKYRIGGFKNVRDGLNFFFTRRTLNIRKNHAVQDNLNIIRLIGIDSKNPKIDFFYTKKDAEAVRRFSKSKYAIIHPGFSHSNQYEFPSREWPAERYARVADYLVKTHNLKVILTGNNEEKSFSDEIKSLSKYKKNIIITNGQISYSELAALISKSRLILAPGTSIIHLACAYDVPIVELMGKEDPKEWHPWTSRKNYRILFHPEVCTQCDKVYCRKKTQECMKAISSEEVINTIESLIKK